METGDGFLLLCQLLSQQLRAVDLLLSTLLTGRSQLLAKRIPAISAAKRGGIACNGVLLRQQVKHSPFEELQCDEQVAPKEQGAGASPLISCHCHQKEFSQGHSSVSGREGAARDLSSLLLMKVNSITAMEAWSHSRGIQEADASFLLINVALISLHTCLQK